MLLHLQIDSTDAVAKYNLFHKPPGPGGGQFAHGPGAGGSSALPPGFQHVGQTLGVDFVSTYPEGIPGNEEIDIAHRIVKIAVLKAILQVTNLGFRPGMPGYGVELHKALAEQIDALHYPNLYAEQPYLFGKPLPRWLRLPGSSVPDVVYGPLKHPLAVFDLKTGSAADTSDAAVEAQKQKTLSNMPGDPTYDHFLVRAR